MSPMRHGFFGFCTVIGIALLAAGCGGGTDVGNPSSIVGVVTSRTDGGTSQKVAHAMVILSKRGADPGFEGVTSYVPHDDIGVYPEPLFFDTVYTDNNGEFVFDMIFPGSYVLVAHKGGLVALVYTDVTTYGGSESTLLELEEPVSINIMPYEQSGTDDLSFRGARVAGTNFVAAADSSGAMVLNGVPQGALDLILYRSDSVSVRFDSFATAGECDNELYVDPQRSGSYWTPHVCTRQWDGRPYLLEIYLPAIETGERGVFNGKSYDLRLCFSHPMEALNTNDAVHAFADSGMVNIAAQWWEGSNVLYVSLCVPDTLGVCQPDGNPGFLPGVVYGVTIDTTARTAAGVGFAHEESVRFIAKQ